MLHLLKYPLAFMNDPDVISACESNAFNAAELIAKGGKQRNKAAIMVTYDKQILKYCDTIYEMRGGQLTFAASRKMS